MAECRLTLRRVIRVCARFIQVGLFHFGFIFLRIHLFAVSSLRAFCPFLQDGPEQNLRNREFGATHVSVARGFICAVGFSVSELHGVGWQENEVRRIQHCNIPPAFILLPASAAAVHEFLSQLPL